MGNVVRVLGAMVSVEIEYCVPCGLLDPAIQTQRELLETFGHELDKVSLRTGHGGVFKVAIEDDIVYDNADHSNEFALDTVIDAVENRVSAEA